MCGSSFPSEPTPDPVIMNEICLQRHKDLTTSYHLHC